MAQGRLEKYLGANQSINKKFFLMYNVFSGAFECVRPSDRLCPSFRQILSVRPTDVRPSDRFAMGFVTGFTMGFLYLPPPKGEGKAPKGGHFSSIYNVNIWFFNSFILQEIFFVMR